MQRIDPKETALIVIDMQNYFAHPKGTAFRKHDGAIVQNPQEVILPIQRLIAEARKTGIPIIFLFYELGSYLADHKSHDWDNQIIEELKPRQEDLVMSKETNSGFSNPVLGLYLEETCIKNVVICGIWTYFCVMETALAAQAKGYRVYVATDAICPDLTDGQYESFLKSPIGPKIPIKIPPIFMRTSQLLETLTR